MTLIEIKDLNNWTCGAFHDLPGYYKYTDDGVLMRLHSGTEPIEVNEYCYDFTGIDNFYGEPCTNYESSWCSKATNVLGPLTIDQVAGHMAKDIDGKVWTCGHFRNDPGAYRYDENFMCYTVGGKKCHYFASEQECKENINGKKTAKMIINDEKNYIPKIYKNIVLKQNKKIIDYNIFFILILFLFLFVCVWNASSH